MFDKFANIPAAGMSNPRGQALTSSGPDSSIPTNPSQGPSAFSWYDPGKLAAAQAAQGAGADGRSVLDQRSLQGILSPIDKRNLTPVGQDRLNYLRNDPYGTQAQGISGLNDYGYYQGPVASGDQPDFLNNQAPKWVGQSVKTPTGDTLTYNADGTLSGQFNNPTGTTGKDVVNASYRLDPTTGQYMPVNAGNQYQPSDWVSSGRDSAIALGTVASAGALGAYGLGGAATEGAGAGASGGGLSSADLAALYGTEGYGAGGGLTTAGSVGGAVGGGAGATGSIAANAGEAAGSQVANGAIEGGTNLFSGGATAPAYGTGVSPAASSSGGGFFSSLANGNYGNAASAAGDYLTSNTGLRAGAALGSAYLQQRGASNALNAQTNATNSSNQLSRDIFNTNRSDWAPYRDLGSQGLKGYSNLLSDPSSITSNPGYQFGLNQGQTAIDRSAASTGSLYSGATLKALQRYGQDYGGTKYDQALGRYGNAAQIGATGVSGSQTAGQNYGTTVGNNTIGLGNAQAGNALYNGGMYNNALNGLASAYTNYSRP